jgi:hypothetical protein
LAIAKGKIKNFLKEKKLKFFFFNIFLKKIEQTEIEFEKLLLPHLEKLFSTSDPRLLYIFINNITILLEKCNVDKRNKYLVPLIIKSLNMSQPKLCNSVILQLPAAFDYFKGYFFIFIIIFNFIYFF